MTTAAYVLEYITETSLKSMVKDGSFRAQPGDTSRSITESGIIIRDTTDERKEEAGKGERNIVRPGLIITHLGASYPTEAGQNTRDDGRHKLVIQLVDDVSPLNTQRRKSYHFWLSAIRRKLQANPFRAELDPNIADIFLIQANQISPAGNREYRVHGQMRAGIELTAYVREPRT